jgi:hypothetical protein
MQSKLNDQQYMAMYIAMVVRDAMEDFHVKYLTDSQMAELNPIIRNAIYTALYASRESMHNSRAEKYVGLTCRMIPKYWEPPKLEEDYVYFVSDKFQEDLDRLRGRKHGDSHES